MAKCIAMPAQATVGELLQHIKVTPQAPGSFASLLLSTPDPVTHKPLADKLMLPEIAALFFAGASPARKAHCASSMQAACMDSNELPKELDALSTVKGCTNPSSSEIWYLADPISCLGPELRCFNTGMVLDVDSSVSMQA